MKKLLLGLFLVAIVSSPQLSADFKEEKEGIEAAFKKIVGISNSMVSTAIQVKEGVDKGLAYKEEVGGEASKYYGELQTLTKGVSGVVEAGSNPEVIPVSNNDGKGGLVSRQ